MEHCRNMGETNGWVQCCYFSSVLLFCLQDLPYDPERTGSEKQNVPEGFGGDKKTGRKAGFDDFNSAEFTLNGAPATPRKIKMLVPEYEMTETVEKTTLFPESTVANPSGAFQQEITGGNIVQEGLNNLYENFLNRF